MIQDDKREIELIKLFNLLQRKKRKRSDEDAYLKINGKKIIFELKSTTVGRVSTASPLTLKHIRKWRKYHWIIGIYDKKTEKIKCCYYGSPDDMKAWLDYMEDDINRGLVSSRYLVKKIEMDLVYEIFDKKEFYTIKDAKYVFKNLYTIKQYKKLIDYKTGFSPKRMLKMLKRHNMYYLRKGSWINNPKIPKKYYEKWIKIDSNYENTLKKILQSKKSVI